LLNNVQMLTSRALRSTPSTGYAVHHRPKTMVGDTIAAIFGVRDRDGGVLTAGFSVVAVRWALSSFCVLSVIAECQVGHVSI
tara:strand:- start:11863 stop:12108 length:246 start_codon:yes stop_codon:yes gene_type:complete